MRRSLAQQQNIAKKQITTNLTQQQDIIKINNELKKYGELKQNTQILSSNAKDQLWKLIVDNIDQTLIDYFYVSELFALSNYIKLGCIKYEPAREQTELKQPFLLYNSNAVVPNKLKLPFTKENKNEIIDCIQNEIELNQVEIIDNDNNHEISTISVRNCINGILNGCKYNSLSNDISGCNLVQPSQLVTNYDDFNWKGCNQSKRYLLISASGVVTDFHIDFSGTAVDYQIQSPNLFKIFIVAPPEHDNIIDIFRLMSSQSDTGCINMFKFKKKLYIIKLQPEETLILPSGWPHMVLTIGQGCIIGGNWLHLSSISLAIKVYQMEKQYQMDKRYSLSIFNQGCNNIYEKLMNIDDKFVQIVGKFIYIENKKFGKYAFISLISYLKTKKLKTNDIKKFINKFSIDESEIVTVYDGYKNEQDIINQVQKSDKIGFNQSIFKKFNVVKTFGKIIGKFLQPKLYKEYKGCKWLIYMYLKKNNTILMKNNTIIELIANYYGYDNYGIMNYTNKQMLVVLFFKYYINKIKMTKFVFINFIDMQLNKKYELDFYFQQYIVQKVVQNNLNCLIITNNDCNKRRKKIKIQMKIYDISTKSNTMVELNLNLKKFKKIIQIDINSKKFNIFFKIL